MEYKASIIISVYDNITSLKAVLDSLKLQTEKKFEIIISEDGCHEKMRDFLQSYQFDHDYQHLTQEDIGWRKNKALNRAIRHAHADWLIFIDGDCVLHKRFVEMHLRYADKHTILSGRRVKLDEPTSQYLATGAPASIKKFQLLLYKKFFFGKGNIRYIEEGFYLSPTGILGFIHALRRIKYIIGCNMSFSKEAIYAINGFDESYIQPSVGEDIDLVWRFKEAGYRFRSLRSLAIQYHLWHKEHYADVSENKNKMKKNQLERKYFCDQGLIQLTTDNQPNNQPK